MNLKRTILDYITDFEEDTGCFPSEAQVRETFTGRTEDLDSQLNELEHKGLLRLNKDGDDILAKPTFRAASKLFLRNYAPPDWPHAPLGAGNGPIVLDLGGIGMPMEEGASALYVTDDSMSDAGILSGDIAIISNAPAARGDIIAIEEDGRIVLRRYLILQGIPHTLAENPRRPDLRPAILRVVHGVFWGLIRRQIGRHPARNRPRARYSYSQGAFLSTSSKPPSAEFSDSGLQAGINKRFSYTREAFLTRHKESLPADQVTSTPWDTFEARHREAPRRPKKLSTPNNPDQGGKNRSVKGRENPRQELPEPPGKMGLNETASH